MPKPPTNKKRRKLSVQPTTAKKQRLNKALAFLHEVMRKGSKKNLTLTKLCEKVAVIYNVDAEALRSKHRRSLLTKDKAHGNQLLTDREELLLVGIIQSLAARVEAPSIRVLVKMAETILARRGQPAPGETWARDFLTRHNKNLKRKTAKMSDKSRVAARIPKSVATWLEKVGKYLKDLLPKREFVLNIDETRADPQIERHPTKRITGAQMRDAQTSILPRSDFYTSVVAASAAGWIAFVVYIWKKGSLTADKGIPLPTNYNDARAQRSDDKKFPRYYAVSETGYMTQEIWQRVMRLVPRALEDRGLWSSKTGHQIVVFTDAPSVHQVTGLTEELVGENTHMIYFPPNTSHFLQPLDGTPFANFKVKLRALLEDKIFNARVNQRSLKHIVAETIWQAEEEGFTVKSVKAGFTKRGVWPFNPEIVTANMHAALGTSAPRSSDRSDDMRELGIELVKELIHSNDDDTQKVRRVANLPAQMDIYTPDEIAKYDRETKAAVDKKLADAEQVKEQRAQATKERAEIKAKNKSAVEERKKKRAEEAALKAASKPAPKRKKTKEPESHITNKACRLCHRAWDNQGTWKSCGACCQYFLCETCQDNTEGLERHEVVCREEAAWRAQAN
jgi:hypothetical protein